MANAPTEKLYDQFSPDERLALFLEAMARDDRAEVDRLKMSCPKKLYTMTDAAYADRVQQSFDMVAIVSADLRVLHGRIAVLEAITEGLDELLGRYRVGSQLAFIRGWRLGKGMPMLLDADDEADDENDEDEEERDATDAEVEAFAAVHQQVERLSERATAELRDALTEATRELAGEFLGVWGTFDAFSRKRLGVAPDVAVRAWCPVVADQFKALLARYQRVSPAGATTELGVAMEAAWARQVGEQ